MNRHLNVFVPYSRDAVHEDDLTRAAMVFMRYVPLAMDAFLALANGPRLSELSDPVEVNIQTHEAIPPEAQGEVGRLISVFLTPDESDPDAEPVEVRTSARR